MAFLNRQEWRMAKDLKRSTVMTEEEMAFVNDCISLLNENIGCMQTYYSEWAEQEELYCNEQPLISGKPNSRVNIVNATIEGEIAQIVNPNMAITATGVSPQDDEFANWGRISLEWAIEKNRLPEKLTMHERRRNKFGGAWLKVVWNETYAGGQGLPEIKVPSLNKVFVDQKIACYLDLDDAEYIAETINLSKSYAYETYGDKAESLDYGFNQYKDNGVFQEEDNTNDRGWTLIQWWSKEKGMLRLQEMSGCGVLLFDSFKQGDRKSQNKQNNTLEKPFYKYVNSHYPYFYTPKYTKEGLFHGFGDAKLLIPLQNMLNEMYDKIRIQMRPNIILIDSNSDIDIREFNDNSFNPFPYNGNKTRGQVPIYSIAWGQLTSDMWKMLENIHSEAQRVTRFSDLMTGQQGSTQTATEAAIQQSQGNSHSEREKMLVEATMSRVALYMLSLMMEFFNGGKAFRISGEEAKYEWIDFEKMSEVPAMQPASSSYKEAFRNANPGKPSPTWEHVTDESGKPITTNTELDIKVSIGSGLPKNKAFLWQMIEKLGQIISFDTSSGQPVQKPLLDWKELRSFIKTYLGIPIQEEDEMEKFMAQMQQQQATEPQPQGTPQGIPGQSEQMPQNQMAMPGGQENTEGMGAGGAPAQQENSMLRMG